VKSVSTVNNEVRGNYCHQIITLWSRNVSQIKLLMAHHERFSCACS